MCGFLFNGGGDLVFYYSYMVYVNVSSYLYKMLTS